MNASPLVLDQLLTVTALLHEDMIRSFKGTGLTMARTHLLWELHRLGPSTQKTLATALGVSARNVSGLVDALETAGYLRRESHSTDRRAFQVSLTERGKQAMDRMAREHVQLAGQLVEELSGEQVAQLSEGLTHLISRLRTLIDEAATITDSTPQESAR